MSSLAAAATLLDSEIVWPMVRLSDGLIVNLQTGFACGNHNRDGRGIVHIRPMNVTNEGEISLSDVKYVPLTEADREEKLVRAGDVIFNNTNSPELVGKTGLYSEVEPRAFSNHMTRLRSNLERVRPHYLALALHQLWREGYFADKCNNHVSQASISRAVLLDTEIPLPLLQVQDSLLTLISSLDEQINSARDRLATIPTLLKRFRQSVLAAACSGQLTEDWREENSPEVWMELTLADVIQGKPKNGYSAKPVGYETSWKVLTLTATTSGSFDSTRFKYFDETIPVNSPFWVSDGDIFFQRGNTIEYVGVPALYRGENNQFIYPDLMMRVRANELVLPEFLVLACANEEARQYLRDHATGSQGSMPKINQPTLMSLPLSIPGRDEQAEITFRVESLFALADSIESRLAEATVHVERTTQAILAKAFRGELI